MEKKLFITIQNLFNGDLLQFNSIRQAAEYITLCIEKEIPLSINYTYHYVN